MNCYRCDADYWDHAWIRADHRGRETEVIRCAFCGALETRPALARPATSVIDSPPADGEFVFDAGRFAGKTIAEALAHPTGRQYLDWARKNVERWTPAIELFLSNAASSA